jgi:hypothetical protein
MQGKSFDYYLRFSDAEVEDKLNRRRMLNEDRDRLLKGIREHRADRRVVVAGDEDVEL